MSNVIYIQKPSQRIAHNLRVGYREHVLADRLRSEGKLKPHSVVFDAGNVEIQQEAINELIAEGREIILDTNVAEQSVPGRHSGFVGNAPWAFTDRVLEVEDFRVATNRSVVEPIARFAVMKRFSTVLSSAHYLGGSQGFWRDIDLKSCEGLRESLDREGGQNIGINFPVIVDNAQIKDPAFCAALIADLKSMPIDGLWLRIAGFGGNALGAGVDKMTRAVLEFHELGIPIVMDRLGGLPAYALTSFGVASGYANGLKSKDSFTTGGWLKPTGGGGGGNERAVFVSGLDRRVKVSEMKELFDRSSTARSTYGCRMTSCCSSIEAMLREPEAHNLLEQSRIVSDLSSVPETQRARYFLDNHLEEARLKAERSLRLKKAPDAFLKVSEAAATRLSRMKDALEQTSKRMGHIPFAPEAKLPSDLKPSSSGKREHP